MPKQIIRRKKPKPIGLVPCPVCGSYHLPSYEFGPFCTLSCLQTVIRPLAVTIPEK